MAVAANTSAFAAACSLYCEGPILAAVQLNEVFPDDSKTYVDMPAKQDPSVIQKAFDQLTPEQQSNTTALSEFVAKYFDKEGSDLLPSNATDFTPNPPFLQHIEEADGNRQWAKDVHGLWPGLTRAVAPSVRTHPERHSLLDRKYNVVVPGGRFRESYYWDSFWIIKGLIVGDMIETAQGVTQNLLTDVETYGHVPNGGRIYYTLRSQPPLLSDMVMAVHSAMMSSKQFTPKQAAQWASSSFATLQKEYDFWMSERVVTVGGHKLNRYYCSNEDARPRPESYREDIDTAGEDVNILAEITSAAESGWDFSSRWIITNGTQTGGGTLADTHIRRIVPTDLNTYLYRMESNLARLAKVTRDKSGAADMYSGAAAARADAMNSLMFDQQALLWRDLILPEECSQPQTCDVGTAGQSSALTAACYIPLWGGEAFRQQVADGDVAASLRNSTLVGPGGIMTTTNESGQQWDKPNVWPPLQWILVEGLRSVGTPAAVSYSDELALNWLEGVHKSYNDSGYMHEKYNALTPGVYGAGGEYVPQTGFGWTNGVMLDFVDRYYRG